MEILSWEILESHMKGFNPCVLDMGGTRGLRIGFNPQNNFMFIRIPLESEIQIPPCSYEEFETLIMEDDTGLVLEIRTTTSKLFQEFYKFAGIITEDFERQNQTAYGAFQCAINRWQDLMIKKALLSDDQVLGLIGELVFLEGLITIRGEQAVEAWTGRDEFIDDRHDFRMNNIEVEIKSTCGSRRNHVIHGLGQLMPSEGHILYLLSLKFGNAGFLSGRTLGDQIEIIRNSISGENIYGSLFEKKLNSSGYKNCDVELYQKRFVFSDSPYLILINENFPGITQKNITRVISNEMSNRITDVTYRINVDGLGFAQGSDEFVGVLSNLSLEVK